MRKHPILRAAVILGMTSLMASPACFAQTAPPANSAPASATSQAQQTPAEKFIQDLGTNGMAIVKDASLSQDQRSNKYRDLLNNAFNIPIISKFVLGRAWNTAAPQQQQEFINLFQQLIVKIYGDRLNLYSGEGFQVKSFRPESDKDVVVNSVITHPQGTPPTTIDWRVRQDNGKMTVLDVVVEGISQSITQRQEYTSILEQKNGNFDGLLDVMRQKLQQTANAQTQ